MKQLCELAGELLTNIRATGNAKDTLRVFDHIMNSNDGELVLVAENEGKLCGYAYASYK